MNTIDALKRLERVGGEASRVTKKLKDATKEVATKIYQLSIDEALSSGMSILLAQIEGDRLVLRVTGDGYGQVVYNGVVIDEDAEYRDRDTCLSFARFIARGGLDRVCDTLEERANDAERATQELSNAISNY